MNIIKSMETKMIDEILEIIKQLEDRVKILEYENICLTNELYRLENSLDSRIDILTERFSNN